MILTSIESLMIGMPMPSVLTLRPHERCENAPEDMVLPIWIGPMEATAIAAALEDDEPERPLTHKLTVDLLKALGGQVSRVVIDRVEGSTFFATLYVRCANGMFTRVDARPSDAIALAIRSNALLYVEDDVFEVASCPRAFGAGDDEKIELEEFDKFIEDIEPDDFVTHGGFDL